jgi:hypothetical protein
MTLDEVIALLRRRCEAGGGQNAWAKANGVSGAYVSDVLSRRREPGQSILDPLGLEKVVGYRRKSQNSSRTPTRQRGRSSDG